MPVELEDDEQDTPSLEESLHDSAKAKLGMDDDSEGPDSREQDEDDDTETDAEREDGEAGDDEDDEDDEKKGEEGADEDADAEDDAEGEEPDKAAAAKKDDEKDDDDDKDPEDDFAKAADRFHIPRQFEDVLKKVPKELQGEVRDAFKGQLKAMRSGYTRLTQEQASFRTKEVKFTADEKYRTEHPDEYIVSLFEKDPKLLESVNKKLERLETEDGKRLTELEREKHRSEIDKAATNQAAEDDRLMKRALHVESFARKTADREGIPYELCEDALYNAIVQARNEGQDVSDEDVKQIIAGKATIYRRSTGQHRRRAKEEVIREKTKELNDAKRRPRPQDARPPAPGRVREPRNLEEALTRAMDRIAPDMPKD